MSTNAIPLCDRATTHADNMTLREHYAGQAMAAMCEGAPWPDIRDMPEIARRSVLMAEALIFALGSRPA